MGREEPRKTLLLLDVEKLLTASDRVGVPDGNATLRKLGTDFTRLAAIISDHNDARALPRVYVSKSREPHNKSFALSLSLFANDLSLQIQPANKSQGHIRQSLQNSYVIEIHLDENLIIYKDFI